MVEHYLLEQFVTFSHCETLIEASEELHLSQPALSRSMKKLEAELGVSLFTREGGRVHLNETGKVAADYAQRVLDANHTMEDQVRAFDNRLHTLTVGTCAPMPASELAATLRLAGVSQRPRFEMLADDGLLAGLHDRHYQLAVLHDRPGDSDVRCAQYREERLCIAVAPEHPLAATENACFDDLGDSLVLVAPGIGFWMEVCRAHLPSRNLLVQSSWEALGQLVAASDLPVFSSDYLLAQGTDVPGRRTIPLRDDDAHATYWLACLKNGARQYDAIFAAACT